MGRISLLHWWRRQGMLCRLHWEPRGHRSPVAALPSRQRARQVWRSHPEARCASSSLRGTWERRLESKERLVASHAVEGSGGGRGLGSRGPASESAAGRVSALRPPATCPCSCVSGSRAGRRPLRKVASPSGNGPPRAPGEKLSAVEYILPKMEKRFPAEPRRKSFTKHKGPQVCSQTSAPARSPWPCAAATPVILCISAE